MEIAKVLDHALSRIGQGYGLSRAQIESARAAAEYTELLAILESMEHPDQQDVRLAAVLVLHAAVCGQQSISWIVRDLLIRVMKRGNGNGNRKST